MGRFWDLLVVLADRTLKARYRGSLLGVYWSLLNPILMTVVYTAIFGAKFKDYYEGSLVHYALVVFIGLSVIGFFAASTGQALPSVVLNSGLVNKIRLPMALFPLSTVAAYSVQLAVGTLPIFAIVTVLVTHQWLRLLLLPFPLLGLVLLSVGVAFLVSTAYVFFRDIPHVYELVTFLAWVTSPVFYPVEIVQAQVRRLLYFNPLYPTFESLRQIVVGPQLPDPTLIAASLFNGIVACALGYLVFNGLRRQFMDLI
jgi:ABC-2 type transport system permease protein/lipopolysaccharide transport system permease protein